MSTPRGEALQTIGQIVGSIQETLDSDDMLRQSASGHAMALLVIADQEAEAEQKKPGIRLKKLRKKAEERIAQFGPGIIAHFPEELLLVLNED